MVVASLSSIIHCKQSLLWSICHQLVPVASLFSIIHCIQPLLWSIFHHLGALMCSQGNMCPYYLSDCQFIITVYCPCLGSQLYSSVGHHKHHGIQKFHLLSRESNGQSAHNSHRTNLKDAPKTTLQTLLPLLKVIRSHLYIEDWLVTEHFYLPPPRH